MSNDSLDVRKMQDLELALREADNMVMKKYMNNIGQCEIKEIDEELSALNLNSVLRLNKIEKIVYDADENNLEKLMNVYNAVGLCGGSVINIIVSDGTSIDYYVGARTPDANRVAASQEVLVSSLLGNFPGSTISLQKKGEMQNCIDRILPEDGNKVVTVVSGIPGYRNHENKKNESFVQGMEKVIDAMNGKTFGLITISTPLTTEQIAQVKDGYESLYTQISPFACTQISYNESDSNAVAESITGGITKTVGESLTTTLSNSTTKTTGETTSKSFNGSLILVGASKTASENESMARQKGISEAESKNTSEAETHTEGTTKTYTNTSGRTLQISIENKSVKNLMDKINDMLKRIEDSADLGLWNTATYCVADNSQTSQVLASAVEAICRGEKTTIESFSIETWTDARKREQVKEYLRKLVHPVVLVDGNHGVFEVCPTSLINGKELVIEAGLPQKSVPGLPVSEMVAFSRNVVNENATDTNKIKLGYIYHMGSLEKTMVNLDVDSLASHTLIAGTTGSGKSNTVYHILNELMTQGIRFLVVEPAKGEYKHIFGNRSDVRVYGTNQKVSTLLRINPFKFPKSIHVLEHIDRLIEIFNVCWPMYAAMPAVLKDAVLSAYESCGWDLEESENEFGENIYPSFKDLQRELIAVLDKSAYSDEVKGNYIGSLATRVKSLTNGIYGKIFTSDDIEYSEIFDNNAIIDLSRVGSSETKALIMGIVVMLLNEYRMEQSLKDMNQKLKHVTVLEEAHNLLRNSDGLISSGEGGTNLATKSVEMLTNSIAEMRTYGEGFIIVDQSPNAIDISAIRNTNTKIIMRLPEDSDRKQAGRAAALKEKQIDELAKLHRGIAVVYQNNWLDPVLCLIDKADVEEIPYQYQTVSCGLRKKSEHTDLLKMLMKNRVDEKVDFSVGKIEHDIETSNWATKTKILLRDILNKVKTGEESVVLQEKGFKTLSEIVVNILECEEKLPHYSELGYDCDLLQQELNREIQKNAEDLSKELILAISQCVLRQIVEMNDSQVELYSKWREFAVEQRKLV